MGRFSNITVKYAGGRCIACRRALPIGTKVSFDRWTRCLRHYVCPRPDMEYREPRISERVEYPEPTKPEKRIYGMPHLHSHERRAQAFHHEK